MLATLGSPVADLHRNESFEKPGLGQASFRASLLDLLQPPSLHGSVADVAALFTVPDAKGSHRPDDPLPLLLSGRNLQQQPHAFLSDSHHVCRSPSKEPERQLQFHSFSL